MATRHELYEQLHDTLECIECDSFLYTSIKMFSKEDLKLLSRGEVVPRAKIKSHPDARDSECHAVTAWAWLTDMSLTVYAGVAYMDDFSEWVQHSFAADKHGTLIEPTPMLRSKYFGAPMNIVQILPFVKDELPNIRNLGFDPSSHWNACVEEVQKNIGHYTKKLSPKAKSKLQNFLEEEKKLEFTIPLMSL